jgi:hypothetical protein
MTSLLKSGAILYLTYPPSHCGAWLQRQIKVHCGLLIVGFLRLTALEFAVFRSQVRNTTHIRTTRSHHAAFFLHTPFCFSSPLIFALAVASPKIGIHPG